MAAAYSSSPSRSPSALSPLDFFHSEPPPRLAATSSRPARLRPPSPARPSALARSLHALLAASCMIGAVRLPAQTTVSYADSEDRSTSLTTTDPAGLILHIDAGAAIQSGAISGPWNLIKTGNGDLTLSAANTFSGNTTIESGTLTLAHSLALQNSTLQLSSTGGAIDFGSLTSITLGGLSGDKDLDLVNADHAPISLTIGKTSGDMTIYSGNLTGQGSLLKIGTSRLRLDGANNHLADISIREGILEVGPNASIVLDSPLTLGSQADEQTELVIYGTLSAPAIVQGPGFGSLGLNGTLRATQDQTDNFFQNFTSGVVFLYGAAAFDTNGHDVRIATPLSGNIIFTKIGEGTLTIAGEHTYLGTLAVQGGTLRLDGATLPEVHRLQVSDSPDTDSALVLENGTQLNITDIYAASSAGGRTEIIVRGPTTSFTSVDLHIGSSLSANTAPDGTNVFDISDGASVTSESAILRAGSAAAETAVTITGAGTTWNIRSNLDIATGQSADFLTPDRIRTTFTISNGASVLLDDYAIAFANSAKVLVTDPGSTWSTGFVLAIDGLVPSSLTIQNGATVTSPWVLLANGDVTASGAGTSWTIGELKIGVSLFSAPEYIQTSRTLTVTDGAAVSSLGGVMLADAETTGHLALHNGGTLTTPFIGKGAGSATITIDGGILRATGNEPDFLRNLSAGDVVFASGGATLDTAGHDIGIAAPLSGDGGLTKIGTGTLTLSDNNTYTGDTAVLAGTLIVDGSLAANTLTTVHAGAILGGSGTVGNLTLRSGATLAPGNSPGTLHADGDVFWNGGTTYVWELGATDGVAGTDWDLLSISGALYLTATPESPITLALIAFTEGLGEDAFHFESSRNYTFTLVTATDGIFGFDASAFALDFAGFADDPDLGVWSLVLDDNALSLRLTAAIPEPAGYATLVGGLSLLLATRRRRHAR